MKAFFLVVVFLLCAASWLAESAGAQSTDSCLKLEFPDGYFDTNRLATYSNPDSVLIDSCESSPTYLELYGTKLWDVDFAYYVIQRNPAPHDTTIEMSWTSIDTSYGALRVALAALEGKYGTLH